MPGSLSRQIWAHDPTIHAPAKYKRACSYEAFIPDALSSLVLQFDGTLAGLVAEAELEIRELNNDGGPALDPLARLLLRTESIASSKVEGMQLGVRELARAEARAESGITLSPTAVELIANIDAMVLAVDKAAEVERFGVPEIVAIHTRLLEKTTQRAIAGRIRDSQNWIGGNDYNPCGAEFVPPPPDAVDGLLKELCAAIHDESLSPLVQAALVHAQFETIHPFLDGNGRTGRALVHVILRRRGIAPRFLPPISVIFAGAKDRYIDGLTKFRGDAIIDWIEHFAVATLKAARLARAYINAVHTLQERWRAQLRASRHNPRADAAAWLIIDFLPAHPMVSAPVAAAITSRARGRIYEGIEQLVDAGVLVPLSEGKRNRWWEAVGLLNLVAGIEAGELPAMHDSDTTIPNP